MPHVGNHGLTLVKALAPKMRCQGLFEPVDAGFLLGRQGNNFIGFQSTKFSGQFLNLAGTNQIDFVE